jgi:hypothetical protein
MVFDRSVQIPDAVSQKLNSTIRGMVGYDDARMLVFISKIAPFANCKIMIYAQGINLENMIRNSDKFLIL